MEDRLKSKVVCIGGGPAGLTAAYLLSKHGVPVEVLEADGGYVGGIARTVNYKGFLFDIGGHRFFSKSKEIEDLWTELLPDDMLLRPRSSRVHYRGKFFSYPLRPFEALWKLGLWESILCVLSYLKAKLFPVRNPRTVEDWVSNQFGWRLYSIFFKTYTEKVWGMKCSEISADWAAQRIKGLSLMSAVLSALRPRKSRGIKTLITEFRYPRKGPGMLWEAAARRIREQGGTVRLGARVTGLKRLAPDGWEVSFTTADGAMSSCRADYVLSSMPLRDLVTGLDPRPAPEALAAAGQLKYRDFILVALMLRDDRQLISDNWIYINDPQVRVGRVQNFKQWSPEMVPDPSRGCYGLEYFCQEGDDLWTMSDADLVRLATREIDALGLAPADAVLDGCVVRQQKAYPVYDEHYLGNIDVLRKELDAEYPGLILVGRNGMHRYNNQDHAMMTAILAVKNILAGKPVYDLWMVNQDAEYHEEAKVETPKEVGRDY